ncbi:Delta-like protein 4 [Chamberlinius hualienensis]
MAFGISTVTFWAFVSIIFLTMVNGDAVLEVRILSFRNPANRLDSGECCQGQEVNGVCRSLCLSLLRVCVTDANVTSKLIKDNSLEICKYGLYVTEPTFGGVRDGHPKNDHLNIVFRFPYAWQGDFGIIMEAWHRTTNIENSTFVGGFPARFITRTVENKHLTIHDGWKKEKETSGGESSSVFEYVMQVQCQTAFYGDNCSEMCLDRNNEFGHYICTAEGEKECRPGWTGSLCTQPICGEGCNLNHGYCTNPSECDCRLGWRGPTCDECVPLPGCVHGSCKNSSFECSCDDGWDGLFCSDPICKKGCHSTRGYCNEPDECSCRIGWSGELCNKCKPLPGCAKGTCQKPFECLCEEGYQGLFCESPICKKTCHPTNGLCKRPGECRCRIGWTGPNCDECVPYPGCKNGNCTLPWECNCRSGWGGLLCDEALTYCDLQRPCKNGGTCISRAKDNGHYICVCKLGFSGKDCEVKVRE